MDQLKKVYCKLAIDGFKCEVEILFTTACPDMISVTFWNSKHQLNNRYDRFECKVLNQLFVLFNSKSIFIKMKVMNCQYQTMSNKMLGT
jgi:hypothetical protein